MSYELQFDASVAGVQQLVSLEQTIEQLAKRTGASEGALKLFKQIVQESTAEGMKLNAILAALTQKNSEAGAEVGKLAQALRNQIKDAADAEKAARQLAASQAAAERGFRGLAAAQEAANRENQKFNQQHSALAGSIKEWITNPMGSAGQAAEGFVTSYGKMGLAVLGVGTAAVVAGGWLVKTTLEVGKYAEEISNTAARTGLTTTETQLFSRAAQVAGINAEALTTSMRTLSRGLSENSDEGKKQKEVLRELGMESGAAFRPMGELLPEIFSRLSQVGNAMERDRMLVELFGRGGLELAPLLGNLTELEARVKATGVVMSEQGIRTLDEYTKSTHLLGLEIDAIKEKLALATVGFIKYAAGALLISRAGGVGVYTDYKNDQMPEGTPVSNLPSVAGMPFGAPHGQPPEQALRDANAQKLAAYNLAGEEPKTRIEAELKAAKSDREGAESRFVAGDTEAKRSAAMADLKQLDAKIKLLKEQEKALSQNGSVASHWAEEAARAQAKELTGIQKINAEYAIHLEQIERERKEGKLPGGLYEEAKKYAEVIRKADEEHYRQQLEQSRITNQREIETRQYEADRRRVEREARGAAQIAKASAWQQERTTAGVSAAIPQATALPIAPPIAPIAPPALALPPVKTGVDANTEKLLENSLKTEANTKALQELNVLFAQHGLPTLPKFAGGGITSGPSIAGEAGQEFVFPLSPVLRGPNPPDPSEKERGLLGLLRENYPGLANWIAKSAKKVWNDPGLRMLPGPLAIEMSGARLAGQAAEAGAEAIEAGQASVRAQRAAMAYRGGGNAAAQATADSMEARLSKSLGIPQAPFVPREGGLPPVHPPFDLQNQKVGIEIKTLVSGKIDRLPVPSGPDRALAYARKDAVVAQEGIQPFTVGVDLRGSKPVYYAKEGYGAFRLGGMKRFERVSDLKAYLPAYAGGGMVAKTGIAQVEAGEAVIPSADNLKKSVDANTAAMVDLAAKLDRQVSQSPEHQAATTGYGQALIGMQVESDLAAKHIENLKAASAQREAYIPDKKQLGIEQKNISIAEMEARDRREATIYEAATHFREELLSLAKKDAKEQDENAKATTENDRRLEDARTQGQERIIRDAAQRQVRNVEAGGLPGHEAETAVAVEHAQVQAAQVEAGLNAARIQRENAVAEELPQNTDEERRYRAKELIDLKIQGIKNEDELYRQIDDARMERERRIIELQKQEQEKIVNAGVGLIMAAQKGGRSVADFVKGELEGLERKVIGNVLTMAVQSPQGKSIAGGLHLPGKLGDIFAGTPFGHDPAKVGADATADNTSKVQDNTTKTDANTQAITALTDMLKQLQQWATSPSGAGGSAANFTGGLAAFGELAGLANQGSADSPLFANMPPPLNIDWSSTAAPLPGIAPGLTDATNSNITFAGDSPLLANMPAPLNIDWTASAAPLPGTPAGSAEPVTSTITYAGEEASPMFANMPAPLGINWASNAPDFGGGTGNYSSVSAGSTTSGTEPDWSDEGTTYNGTTDPISGIGPKPLGGLTVGKGLVDAGAAAAGIIGAIQGFSRGNAGGDLKGVASLTGAAAVIDPEPVSKAALAGVAMVTGLISSLISQGPQQRSEQIQRTLMHDQFYTPTPLNVSMSTGGGYADTDFRGNVRGSNLSPYPQVEEPYSDFRNNTQVPGRVVSPFGGQGGNTTNITYSVQAMDAQSVQQFFVKHGPTVAQAVAADFSTNQITLQAMRRANVV